MEESKGNFSSFTMDYERDEIVVTIYGKDSQMETRFTEKDIMSMQNWFNLAKYMKNEQNDPYILTNGELEGEGEEP
nr:hypothetical protein [Heyndrickxia oleronia]